MYLCPPFLDSDKEQDTKAYSLVSKIIPTIFSEFYVIILLFINLTSIARNIVFLPFQILFNITKISTPQYKYACCVTLCMLISYAIPTYFHIDLEISTFIITHQSFYKIWAIYTLFFIIIRFLYRVHKHTHRILRGAIREGKLLIVPVFLHTLSDLFMIFSYDVYIGTYLSGQYGKPGLFISACLHIQAVITKKYLPKILEVPPENNMAINRMVLVYAVTHHLSEHQFGKMSQLIAFEYLFVFIRLTLTALTEDCDDVLSSLKNGVRWYSYQFVHNEASAEDSAIMNLPLEHFTVLTMIMITKGPTNFSIIVSGVVLVFAVFGSIIIKMLCPKSVADIVESKKNKKDKKDKEKDGKDETEKKDKTKVKDE